MTGDWSPILYLALGLALMSSAFLLRDARRWFRAGPARPRVGWELLRSRTESLWNLRRSPILRTQVTSLIIFCFVLGVLFLAAFFYSLAVFLYRLVVG